jgi:hypothetical protein
VGQDRAVTTPLRPGTCESACNDIIELNDLRGIVSVKITEEVLTAYLHCKYKAYLLLTGVVQEPSEYE